jgi:hypothetical protein
VEQQELDAAARDPASEQAGRHHLRVVRDDEITLCEEVREVREPPVLGLAAGQAQDHQPRLFADGLGPRGDALRGKLVVPVGQVHGAAR